MVRKLDAFIVYLQQRIAFLNLDRRCDIIILSDHGMRTVTPRNFIDLFEYVDKNVCSMYGTSPVLQVICNDGRWDEACKNLTAAAEKLQNFKAYTDEQLPERWRVMNKQRFGPCTVVAEPDYAFQDMYEYALWFHKKHGITSKLKSI